MARIVLLFFCFWLSCFCASCSVRVEGFVLRGAQGEAVSLYLDSGEGWKEPGDVFLSGGGEIIFRFQKPLTIQEGFALYLGFADASEGLVLRALRGEKGNEGVYAQSPLFAAAGGGLFLRLEPGICGGFSIARTGNGQTAAAGEPAGESAEKSIGESEGKSTGESAAIRVLSAAIVPYEPVFRMEPSGEIYASSAILPLPMENALPGDCRVRLVSTDSGGERSLRVRLKSEIPCTPRLSLYNGKQTFSVRAGTRPVSEDLWFHSRFLGFTPQEAGISGLAPGGSIEIFLEENPVWGTASSSFVPVPADLASVTGAFFPNTGNPTGASPSAWRGPDFEVFRWSLFPGILVFDSRDYTVQKCLFHRLAFFIEKTGFRGKLHPDADIWNRHGWNAHNYSAAGLALFFETARTTDFPLNAEERWLGDYLVSLGVLQKENEIFLPGRGGILGISRESTAAARSLLLCHEAFHGVYYEIPEYRGLVEKTWQELPQEQKEFWNIYFTWMGYDTADHYLLVNEFQAYLLQQPLSRIDAYYKITIAQRLSAGNSSRGAWIAALLEKYPAMFSSPARILSSYLEKTVGIRAGDVESLRPD